MKNNKGITLVSLIVTIIVMVILSGIALVFSVGEGGIIERSQKAEVEQLLAKEKELVELAVSDAKITTRNSVLTGNILTQALKNQDLEPDRELSEKAPFIFKIKDGTGKTYIVLENGEINVIDTEGEIDEEYLVNIAIETAKKSEGGLTGTNLTNALNKLGLESDRQLSETAPFIFKIKNGTGKEYIVMNDGTIGTTEGNAKDWIYTVTGTNARITGSNLTGESLKNVIVPKYLTDEYGTVLTVTHLGNSNNMATYLGSAKDKIAEFKGTLILPDDIIIYPFALNSCPDIEKVIFGKNTIIYTQNDNRQFTAVNVKLKEVQIGEGSIINYQTFSGCSNLEKVIVGDNVTIKNGAFINCEINNIEIANNVTVEGRAFFKIQNEIEKITIGDNFVSAGCWLEYCTVKDIEIGNNASLANNGLMAQYNVTITGTVTINGELKKIGSNVFKGCTIKTQNNCLKVPENEEIGAAALHSVKGIERIIFGKNAILKYNGTVFIKTADKVYIEVEGPITVSGAIFAGNTVLPSKMEFSGESIIDTTFYYLSDTNKNSLKEIVLNPGATVTSLSTYPKDLKITLKNISEWNSETLASNKTVIEAFGLTKYEVIDGNGVYTK